MGNLSGLADALGVAEQDLERKREKRLKGLGVGGAKTRRKLAGKETVRLQKVSLSCCCMLNIFLLEGQVPTLGFPDAEPE